MHKAWMGGADGCHSNADSMLNIARFVAFECRIPFVSNSSGHDTCSRFVVCWCDRCVYVTVNGLVSFPVSNAYIYKTIDSHYYSSRPSRGSRRRDELNFTNEGTLFHFMSRRQPLLRSR